MGKSVRNSRQPVTLYDHFRELRTRLVISIGSLLAASCFVYLFYTPILAFLSSPLNEPLYYSSPAGGFAFIMKICFTGGLIIAVPILVYNLIMFIRPAFEKALPMSLVISTTGASTVLAIAGAIFAFGFILPGTLLFLKGFQSSGLTALISADNYLGFVTNIIIMFVLIFQIPLIISFIDKIKPLQPKKLLKMEKWVIIGSLVVALLAPFTYDFVTSLLIALPIVILYNLSIIIIVTRRSQESYKADSIVRAVIIKPIKMTDVSLNEDIIDVFTDELISLEKIKPTIITPTCMDAITNELQSDEVKPAAWFEERRLLRLSLNAQKVKSSDISSPRSNRALTLQ